MGQVYHIKTREEFAGDAASGPRLPVLRDPSPTSGLGASRGIAIAREFSSSRSVQKAPPSRPSPDTGARKSGNLDPDEAYANAIYREIEDALFWMGVGASAALWLVALVMAVRA